MCGVSFTQDCKLLEDGYCFTYLLPPAVSGGPSRYMSMECVQDSVEFSTQLMGGLARNINCLMILLLRTGYVLQERLQVTDWNTCGRTICIGIFFHCGQIYIIFIILTIYNLVGLNPFTVSCNNASPQNFFYHPSQFVPIKYSPVSTLPSPGNLCPTLSL